MIMKSEYWKSDQLISGKMPNFMELESEMSLLIDQTLKSVYRQFCVIIAG